MRANLKTIHIEEGFYFDILEIAMKYHLPIKGVTQALIALGLEVWDKMKIDSKLDQVYNGEGRSDLFAKPDDVSRKRSGAER